VNCSGFGESIVVNGSAYIDSTATPSIKLSGFFLSFKTEDPSTQEIYTGANLSGALDIGGNTVEPTPLQSGVAPDPYAGSLTPPSPPALGQLNSYGAQDISTTESLADGNYGAVNITNAGRNPITVTLNGGEFASLSTTSTGHFFFGGSDVNLVLNPGNYVFNGAVTLGAPGNVTLSPGEYAGGISLQGSNIDVTLASGTYILGSAVSQSAMSVSDSSVNDSLSGLSGVLLYVQGGSVDLGGIGESVSFDPELSGPYSGITLWQASSDTSAINLLGNGVGVAQVGGTIYAPDAVLGSQAAFPFGFGNSYNVGGLVAAGITCPGFAAQLTING
jgi:hypothetical protein